MSLNKRFIQDIYRTLDDDCGRQQIQFRWVLKILVVFVLAVGISKFFYENWIVAGAIIMVAVIFFCMYWIVYLKQEKGLPIVILIMNITIFAITAFLMIFSNSKYSPIICIFLVPSLTVLLTGVKKGIISSSLMLAEVTFFFWTPLGRSLANWQYAENILWIFPIVYLLLTILTVFFEQLRVITFRELRESRKRERTIYVAKYESMTDKIQEAKCLRHDMRHHYVMIKSLLEGNRLDELNNYVSGLNDALPGQETLNYCECYSINALLTYFVEQYKSYHIDCTVNVDYPKNINVSSVDLTIIFGNLLENALEAGKRVKKRNPNKTPSVKIIGEFRNGILFLNIENDMLGRLAFRNGKLLSSKRDDFVV